MLVLEEWQGVGPTDGGHGVGVLVGNELDGGVGVGVGTNVDVGVKLGNKVPVGGLGASVVGPVPLFWF